MIVSNGNQQGSVAPAAGRPVWPDRLIELGALARGSEDRAGQARSELWGLLNVALQHRIRAESRRTGPIGVDDLVDLAAEKSLELMSKFDAHEWDPANTPREKIIGFVSTVARNGLIDFLRRSSRHPTDLEPDMDSRRETDVRPQSAAMSAPDARVERTRFVEALVDCVGKLREKHRTVWLFRVLLEMRTNEIARHPDVELNSGHVDVIMQRCRAGVRDCMREAGYEPTDMPVGTFTELWRAFRLAPTEPGTSRSS